MNRFWLKRTLNKTLLGLLVLVGLALLSSSCEKSNGEIGAGKFIEDRPELGEKLSFSVVSYTTNWDSITTKNPVSVALGNLNDPIFGKLNAAFTTRLLLSKLSPDFGDSTVCDSVKVRLAYQNTYGLRGDSIHLEVLPVIEPMSDTINYYSNTMPVMGPSIMDTTLMIDPSVPVFNGIDTSVGYLTFDLDPSFFQEKLFDAAIAGEDYLIDNESFVASVPGLHFRDAGTGTSALSFFNLTASGSLIQLFYHTGAQDTVPKLFTMTFGQNFGDPGLSFNSYENDFTTADFGIDMQDTLNGEVLTYSQGAGGARTILEFPGLDTLIGKGYSINRAEIIAHVLQGTASPYTLPNTLLILQDLDSSQALIKDYTNPINPAGGAVNRADLREFRYRFNVTRMVHDFVNEKEKILPVILTPASSNSSAARVVLGGGLHPTIPVEFNVYYTKSD